MKTHAMLATLVATGSLLVAGAGVPAFAGSAMSDAFVANVHPNVDFLDSSSRLALDVSSNTKIRAFARGEATEQTITSNSLVAWTQTNTRAGAAVALGDVQAADPLATIATAPLDVAGNVATGVDGVVTGRSVAVDRPLAPLTVTPAATTRTAAPGVLLPAGEADMARLSKLHGRQFDAFYLSTQTDALHQLATLYLDYMHDGDDPALRAIAARELPRVQHRLADIHAL